jgi:hypothetical protein
LSLTLFLRGTPVLVDAGFYSYNGSEPWERHFRETAAHSTARINRRDQARHLGKMAWSNIPSVHVERWMSRADQAWFSGSHDGYAADGVVHRRTVWLRPGGYMLIHDEFCGGQHYDLEVNFQLAPGIRAELQGQQIVGRNGLGLAWCASTPMMARACEGGALPDEGWIASRLDSRIPAPRLTLFSPVHGPYVQVLTVASDLARATVTMHSAAAAVGAPGPVVATIHTPDFTDHLIAGGGRWTAGAFETDAALAVWRTCAGRVIEATRIGGTYQTHETTANRRTSRCAE